MFIFNDFIKIFSLLAVILFSTTANSTSVQFDVFAKTNSSTGGTGLVTGLNFTNGDSISGSVSSTDLWNAGSLPRWSNADGLTTDLFATGSDESGQLAGTKIGQDFSDWTQDGFTAPFGSLVGKINGTYFLLGTSFNVTAPETGLLSLYYWDSNSADNTDSVQVSISTVPLPAAVWLFGCLAVWLFGCLAQV